MAAPPVPSALASITSVARLSLQRLTRSHKLRLALISSGLILAAVATARYAADSATAEGALEAGVRYGFFSLLAYLVPFLFTSGSLAEEVEGRTLPFLTARPVGRIAIALGKYVTGAGMAALVVAGSLLLLHLILFATSPGSLVEALPGTLRTAGALALLTLVYGGICSFWGAAVPEVGGIVATLHLAIVEFLFGWMPGVFRLVSASFYARQLAGLPKGGLMVETVPDIPPLLAAGVLLTSAILLTGLSAVVVQVSELRFRDA